MSLEIPARKRPPYLKIIVLVLVIAGVGGLALRGVNLRALAGHGMDLLRHAGPGVFFTAMALLPALGVPMLAFTLTVGPTFGAQMGMGWVVISSLVALTINIALTYALARRALRPLLQRLITRLGYKLPQVAATDTTDLIIIFRLTPGIPFCIQNYLLGLAEVPFGKYLLLSCLMVWPQVAAFVVFGEALSHGKGGMILMAAGLVVAVVAATHLVRKHYKGRTSQG